MGNLATAGIDNSPIADGRPSETLLPKCYQFFKNNDTKNLFPDQIEEHLHNYFITGLCEDFNSIDSYRVCVLLRMKALFHIYYEDRNKKLRCLMVPFILDQRLNLKEKFSQFVSNESDYVLYLPDKNFCNNHTCNITLSLNVSSIYNWALAENIDLNQDFISDIKSPQFVEDIENGSFISNHRPWYKDYWVSSYDDPENVSEWEVKFHWHRAAEPFEGTEVNYSSVGAPMDTFSGIYSLHGVALNYTLSPKNGFADLKENDENKTVMVGNWTWHKMRARSGDYFTCKDEVHIQLFETNNTFDDPFENEDDHYEQKNLHLLHSESIRVLLVLQNISVQLFSEIFNATYFHGDFTQCPADETSDSRVSLFIFLVLTILVFIIGTLQCINRCKENEKATKKAEIEGMNIFFQHQQRYPYAPLPFYSKLPAIFKTYPEEVSREDQVSLNNANKRINFLDVKRNISKCGPLYRRSPTPSIIFNTETITEVTEDEQKSSTESYNLMPLSNREELLNLNDVQKSFDKVSVPPS